ncbi:MAG: BglII/BstYI family type II restriction endonuclease [bacterium]
MGIELLPSSIRKYYEIHEWKHACAIIKNDFPNEWDDIINVLGDYKLCKSYMSNPGGGKSASSKSLDTAFYALGWEEKKFETKIVVDHRETITPTHKVDCFKNKIALEIEWSNKDPFFDRDLNNFRLLFDLRAIGVGVIITKSDELRKLMERLNVWKKYGTTTTWMKKLIPRIEGGGGAGCPILVFGITNKLYDKNC